MSFRDYESDESLIRQILSDTKYAQKLVQLSHREEVVLVVDLDDVHKWDPLLAIAVKDNTRRYVELFSQVVDSLLPEYRIQEVPQKDSLDVFIEHRLLAQQRRRQEEAIHSSEELVSKYPKELMRRFEVLIGFVFN